MSVLTMSDLSLLRDRGFKVGPTGHAWYAKDSTGDVWRAYSDANTDRLLFSVEGSGISWGPSASMNREDFDELFESRSQCNC